MPLVLLTSISLSFHLFFCPHDSALYINNYGSIYNMHIVKLTLGSKSCSSFTFMTVANILMPNCNQKR